MSVTKSVLKTVSISGLLLASTLQPVKAELSFQEWLSEFRTEAVQEGVSSKTISATLDGLTPNQRVIELDQRQPEFSLTFAKYMDGRISDKRVQRGRDLWKQHSKLFEEVEAKYGVPGRFLVAFWGLETNFGDFTGSFPLVQSLATLAHNPRRREFFSRQLIASLQLMDEGDLGYDVNSSWAGAMGYCQFMPTTFQAYAVDGDGDGKRDLWGSLPDIFHSAGNFLAQSGWVPGKTWGREVKVPASLNFDLSGLDTKMKLSEWNKLGLRKMDGSALPAVDIDASLILPSGYKGPAFLVYENFRTILDWNRSNFYAISVGHLADRIAWQPPFVTPLLQEKPLSRNDTIMMQTRLNEMGYNVGKPDGIAGTKTRRAIKQFQKSKGIPADGHPNQEILGLLK